MILFDALNSMLVRSIIMYKLNGYVWVYFTNVNTYTINIIMPISANPKSQEMMLVIVTFNNRIVKIVMVMEIV